MAAGYVERGLGSWELCYAGGREKGEKYGIQDAGCCRVQFGYLVQDRWCDARSCFQPGSGLAKIKFGANVIALRRAHNTTVM
jgi:hypothetical protein